MPPVKPTCCLLTHAGRGAVAIVGVVGDATVVTEINDRLFDPIGSRSFSDLVTHSDQVIFYGQWKSTAEDLVVAKTEHGLEIHCHGGDAASATIIDDLKQTGCEGVSKQQWRLIYSDRWRAESETAICEALTIKTANLLLRVFKNQPAALSELSTLIRSRRIPQAIVNIEQSLSWADFGLKLTQPQSLVFCGQPNVGKSSLVNAVAGFQRAIVNSQAGTTRDVLSQSTAIDGWPVDLKDTAGLRASQDQIESLGIEKAKVEIAKSQIRCLVFSCEEFQVSSEEYSQVLIARQQLLKQLKPQLIVFNKSDLVSSFKPPADLDFSGPTVVVSTVDRSGLQVLVDNIAKILVPAMPLEELWYPVSSWQRAQLRLILQQLKDGNIDAAQSSMGQY